MISRESAIVPSNHTANFSGLDGFFIRVTSGGLDVVIDNATAYAPLGVIAEGAARNSSIALQSCGYIVKVKLSAISAAVIRGSYLTLRADGSVGLDPGTGARVRVARAIEPGQPGELIDAYLIDPTVLA